MQRVPILAEFFTMFFDEDLLDFRVRCKQSFA